MLDFFLLVSYESSTILHCTQRMQTFQSTAAHISSFGFELDFPERIKTLAWP